MAMATVGDDENAASDGTMHEYYDLDDGAFLAEITPYLSEEDGGDRVPLKYAASVSGPKGQQIDFERTKLVPAAALQRARNEKGDFLYKFCHSIAFAYQGEMITELGEGNFVCGECGKPAEKLIQGPNTDFAHNPPLLLDMGASPVCGDPGCATKLRNKKMMFTNMLSEVFKRVKTESSKTGSAEIATNLPTYENDITRVCLGCSAVGVNLLRCSRCKKVYFCNKECQRKAWKKHKKECMK